MLKDIDFNHSGQTAIAIVPENSGDETIWVAYFINYGPETLDTVMVNSYGYGEINQQPVKTATLRWMLGDIAPNEICKIEDMPAEISLLTNEFWVSYYINNKIFDKKYVFVLDSMNTQLLTDIPFLNQKGVLIR